MTVSKGADSEQCLDVIGVGEAIIDFSAQVEGDQFLVDLRVDKGGRRVIDIKERTDILESLQEGAYRVCAGGSVSNSLVGISQLGRAFTQIQATEQTSCSVGMTGRVGDDVLGQCFQKSMISEGVQFLSPSQPGSSTGTVIVLTSQDAQRTFLAFQGDSNLQMPTNHHELFSKAKIIVIEGYLLEHSHSLEKILQIIKQAKQSGVLTAVSAGDAGLVKRSKAAFRKIMESGIDIFLSNQSEAVSFLGVSSATEAESAAEQLGQWCPIAVVTDGSKGSCIYVRKQNKCFAIQPYWMSEPPVDTTGAGDAYAAGLLYGMMLGLDFGSCGQLGSRMASAVISKIGSRIQQEDVCQVAQLFIEQVQGAALALS